MRLMKQFGLGTDSSELLNNVQIDTDDPQIPLHCVYNYFMYS